MKSMLIATLLLLAAAAQAAPWPSAGDRGLAVTPAGSKAVDKAVCSLGNDTEEYDGSYVANHAGPESYAILIDPATCPTCGLGISLETTYFVLQLQAAAVFQLTVSVADVVDLGGGCYSPGAEQVSYGPNNVPSNGFAGGWIISIPWNSSCLDPGQPYFLVLTFPATGTGVIGPKIDSDGVTPCRGWRNTGSGWTDLASAGFAGDVRMWTEVNCCTEPVPVDLTNWGNLKSMFR